MLPLLLVTGFLGSGKTTLLRKLVEQARGRRLVCIVNEFGPLDVDGPTHRPAPGECEHPRREHLLFVPRRRVHPRAWGKCADRLDSADPADPPLVVVRPAAWPTPA